MFAAAVSSGALVASIIALWILGRWCGVIAPLRQERDDIFEAEPLAQIISFPRMLDVDFTSMDERLGVVTVTTDGIRYEPRHRETFDDTGEMELRLTNPQVYSDHWYSISRRSFSLWVADQYGIQAEFMENMRVEMACLSSPDTSPYSELAASSHIPG